jgi:hypothetical protein
MGSSILDIMHPLHYFESVETYKAAKKFCDVGEAFRHELGMGE